MTNVWLCEVRYENQTDNGGGDRNSPTGMRATSPFEANRIGLPEGIFVDTDRDTVKQRILDMCSSHDLMTMEYGQSQVDCSQTMTGADAMLAQMMVGNSYSTTPVRTVRFTVTQSGNNVRVVAHQWIESQMAFGQVRSQPLSQAKHVNDIQGMLFGLGAK